MKQTPPLHDFDSISPEDVGLDAETLADHVDRSLSHQRCSVFAGRAECVICGFKAAHVNVHGFADVEHLLPMSVRSRFRGFSMTKPLTAVALFVLVDLGRVGLDDPVEWFIPSFSKCVVMRRSSRHLGNVSLKDSHSIEPLKRPVLLRDLLLHTSGLGYGPGRYDLTHPLVARTPVEKAYRELACRADQGNFDTLADFCDALASIPLRFQPGTRWMYSHGLDVIGRVIEVVSGEPLACFLRKKVLRPLGMLDTTFAMTPKAAERDLCAAYKVRRQVGQPRGERYLVRLDGTRPSDSAWVEGSPNAPQIHAGGGIYGSCRGGLVFSLRDLACFCRMLANGGRLPSGQAVLKPATVRSLFKDWLPKRPLPGFDDDDGKAIGWSPIGHVQLSGPHAGAAYMGGVGYWWVDPRRHIAAVTLSECIWDCEVAGWIDDRDDLEKVVQKAVAVHAKRRTSRQRKLKRKVNSLSGQAKRKLTALTSEASEGRSTRKRVCVWQGA